MEMRRVWRPKTGAAIIGSSQPGRGIAWRKGEEAGNTELATLSGSCLKSDGRKRAVVPRQIGFLDLAVDAAMASKIAIALLRPRWSSQRNVALHELSAAQRPHRGRRRVFQMPILVAWSH